jgi:hypothetical protein
MGLLCRKFDSDNTCCGMGISTGSHYSEVYTNQGEQDQVENTIQFAKTATSDQLIPQLQRFLN